MPNWKGPLNGLDSPALAHQNPAMVCCSRLHPARVEAR